MATHFQEIENLVLHNPNKAQQLLATWEKVCQRYPEARYQTEATWYNFSKSHNLDSGLYIAKLVQDYQPDVRFGEHATQPPRPEETSQGSGGLSTISSLAIGAVVNPFVKYDSLEQDPEYLKIKERLEKDWQTKRKEEIDKKVRTKETTDDDLDYLYGSLNGEDKPTLKSQTEAEYRRQAQAKALGLDPKNPDKRVSKNDKMQKRLKRYDEIREKERNKIYDNPQKDKTIIDTNQRIIEHAVARLEVKQSKDKKSKLEDCIVDIRKKEWEEFVNKNPEKVAAYAVVTDKKHQDVVNQIKAAQQRIKEQEEAKRKEEELKKQVQQESAANASTESVASQPAFAETDETAKQTEPQSKESVQVTSTTEATIQNQPVQKTEPPTAAFKPQSPTINAPVNQVPQVKPLQKAVYKQPPVKKIPRTLRQPLPQKPAKRVRSFRSPIRTLPSTPKRKFTPARAPQPPSEFYPRRGIRGGVGRLGNLGNRLGGLSKGLSNPGNVLARQAMNAAIRVLMPYIGIILGFLLVIGLAGFAMVALGQLNFNINLPGLGSGDGGDISECTFYRGGDPVQGLKFSNPDMASKVSEISSKVGVPASIVAGIMRVETSDALTKTDPTYLTKDFDDHPSGAGAIGVMQFMPATFLGIYNSFQNDLKDKFGKTASKITLDPPSNMAPENVFRIYSIKDSITAAAYYVKSIKSSINGDGPWNEATVKKIASTYFSGSNNICNYPGGSYCDDLWKSYSNCTPSERPPSVNAASCPLEGARTIGCGSFMSEPKYNRYSCSGSQPTDRGHCGKNYPSSCSYKGNIDATRNQRRAHSIDVDGQPGEKVYLPTIGGQTVEWKYQLGSSYPISEGDGGGYGHVFTANINGSNWMIHLIHTNPPPIFLPHVGATYKSGDAVTTIANTSYPHLHINIAENPETNDGGKGWIDPEQLGMCAQ